MKFVARFFILFIIGATLGSLFDGFHTHSGTTAYPNIWLLKMAWWTPPLFGMAVVLIGMLTPTLDKPLGKTIRRLTWPSIIIGLFLFGVLYFASGFMPVDPFPKFITIAGGALIIWGFFDRNWQGIIQGLIVAIIGSGVEITLIQLNRFYYTKPEIWGIPFWLPFLYFAGTAVIGNLGRKLLRDDFHNIGSR